MIARGMARLRTRIDGKGYVDECNQGQGGEWSSIEAGCPGPGGSETEMCGEGGDVRGAGRLAAAGPLERQGLGWNALACATSLGTQTHGLRVRAVHRPTAPSRHPSLRSPQ